MAVLAISPLGTSFVLIFVALALFLRRSRRACSVSLVAAVAWLWLWSTPLASDALRGWIEAQAGPRGLTGLQPVEVMVVLGGGVSGAYPPQRPNPDLGRSADRVWHAARIYQAGLAKRIILSGGIVPTGNDSEAEAMGKFLADLGVPAGVMTMEKRSTSTTENALNVKDLLASDGTEKVMLVTSALHMLRARRCFENAGLEVVPAPTDFEVIPVPFDTLRLLPDAQALEGSSRAFKELVGWLAAGWQKFSFSPKFEGFLD
ncbi:MAG: YdcF family protein [Desulfuromonas sp.]|nr:MAG: YdcF family protein [Desulfuromonas sp.]